MNLSQKVNYQQLEANNNYYLYHPEIAPDFTPAYFSSQYWQESSEIVGTAQGRGTTWFIEHDKKQWVLKHYYRGGLIGKLFRDSYLYTGVNKTRSFAEFELLAQLNEFGLPAPKPVACSVTRQGIHYHADIITSRIENANDLVGILTTQSIDNALWQKVGKTIQDFHTKGIYHHDLNIHNILIDAQEKVWIIDFDRGRIVEPAKKWQQENIARLKRSFLKEQNKLDNFYWQEEAFTSLLLGYQST